MNEIKKEKQERKVVHLQIGEQHEYFGSIEQMFCKYGKEDLGFSIYQVRNNLKNLGKMESEQCIIRLGVLQTKLKKWEKYRNVCSNQLLQQMKLGS